MIRQIIILTAVLLVAIVLGCHAQAPGSESVYGGGTSVKSIISGGTSADVSESLYIGPGTHVIDGSWEVYAKNVVIDPSAVITGTGTIQFYNPSVAGGAASGTLIDGNNVSGAIDVNMELLNASGMQLTNIAFPASLTSAGWSDNSAASTVYVGKDLSLAVDGADVTLGTGVVGDLKFDNNATISNYRPARMVIVNNSILSHMVKESYTSAFTFPVGIADGDYTPAQIANASSNTVYVSVQDYAASASPEALLDGAVNTADGMNRTWHIYADAASISSSLNLQHNNSTNQSGFVDATHFVTQWGTATPNTTGDYSFSFGASPWQGNIQGSGVVGTLSSTGAVAGSSMRSRTYSTGLATLGTANQSYFTKSADIINPLPVNLLSFSATASQCDVNLKWSAGVESNLSRYQLQHSTDGQSFVTIATIKPTGSNSNYSYLHKSAVQGNNQYRLMMVNNDQSYKNSPTQLVNLDCAAGNYVSINVYPNPTNLFITVEGMGANTSSVVRILNLHGQLVQELNTLNNKETLDISQLPSANYLLQVVQGNKVKLNLKVVKE